MYDALDGDLRLSCSLYYPQMTQLQVPAMPPNDHCVHYWWYTVYIVPVDVNI